MNKFTIHDSRFTILIFYFFPVFCFLSSILNAQEGVPERYHTYEEAVNELDSIALNYPTITRLDTIGFSTTDSLPILVIKISDNPLIEEDEPALLYNGIHHAEELLSAEVCMYMINDLVTRYGSDSTVTKWIDSLEIWILPILNPDGHNIVTSGIDTIWRKNTRDNNNNGVFDPDSDGVDPNRNYDFLWSDGGSDDHTSEYYRGTSPFSESENQAIRDLTLAQNFVFDICYHSARTGAGEVIYYPWKWGGAFSPDHSAIKEVVDSLAKRIINDAGTGTYIPIWGNAEKGGCARNWFYGKRGTFSYTVEISTGCIPPGEMVDSIVIRNLPGAYFLMDRTLGSSITGCVTDSITGDPLVAEVKILEAYSESLAPRLTDLTYGRYRRILTPGEYTVDISRQGYETVTIPVVVDTGIPAILNIKLSKKAVEETHNSQLTTRNSKLRIYPNPFTQKTVIEFRVQSLEFKDKKLSTLDSQLLTLKIYDIAGKLVKTLVDEEKDIGHYKMHWKPEKLRAGIYFVKFTTDDYKETKKLILMR